MAEVKTNPYVNQTDRMQVSEPERLRIWGGTCERLLDVCHQLCASCGDPASAVIHQFDVEPLAAAV